MENVTVLRDEFAPYFAPVEIGSAKAREMQEAERRRALLSRAPTGSELAPISDRVAAELEKFEAGDIHAWWRLNVELVRSAAPSSSGEFIADLTSLPGWKELDQTLRARCIAAGERYLETADPNNERWLGTNTCYRPAAAGYRALRLLLLERPQIINTFAADIWRKWSSIILGY